ncbi:unnamed protein product [Prorocentrum cordatum]|uniref:Membrane transport protein MMPL domain-containing protein n=1 Tax=Prorocentrum cordatum TaxID=2364126 RepID=A0ABN9WLS9_9DINO|nr:unnamed protein product [Polarella glacialis]
MVTDLTCWLIGFSEWVVANGGTWPVKAGSGFDQLAVRYVLSSKTAGRETKSYVWLDDGATRIQAFFSTVFVDLALSAGAGEALELKAKWDDHLAAFNEDARASVAGAWQTARIWVRAEAERVIVTSTVLTLGIALFLVFVGVLVFTRSFGLAIVVMSTVTMIIVGLFFFMVVVMGWLIGAVEVLSLIMFIGFAVDYCLHIAHKYHACIIHDVTEEADDSHENAEQKTMLEKAGAAAASRLRQSVALTGNTRLGMAASVAGAKILRKQAEGSDGSSTGTPPGRTASPQRTRVTMRVADTLSSSKLPSPPSPTCDAVRQANRGAERFERAKFALEKIGPSVLGSGLTTLGSAAFLLPCSLHVFYRIGAVVCGITVYAEFFALLFLPATLMIIGPAGHNFRGCMLFNLQDWDVDPLSSNIDSHARNKGIYVLNVPVRGMAQMTPGQPASRTRIIASG